MLSAYYVYWQVIKPGTGTPEQNEMEWNGTEVQAHLKLKSNPNPN